MALPGLLVETLLPPATYTRAQLELAVAVAAELARGRLILAEPGRRLPDA